MLFFMGAASHLAMPNPVGGGQKWAALILLLVVMAIVEANAMAGAASPASGGKKMLATLNGTFWGGFIVAVVLYVGLEMIL